MSSTVRPGLASTAPDEAWPSDAVEVARITGAWGVKGWFRLQPLGRDAEGLLAAKVWHLRRDETAPGSPPQLRSLRIRQARTHSDTIVACSDEVADRTQAEGLRGAKVFVARSAFPKTGNDEYYWVDLIGAAVVNRQGQTLGTVSGLLETGAHDVLCVRRPGRSDHDREGEQLIPFVSAYVDSVDVPARRIVVDWGPED